MISLKNVVIPTNTFMLLYTTLLEYQEGEMTIYPKVTYLTLLVHCGGILIIAMVE